MACEVLYLPFAQTQVYMYTGILARLSLSAFQTHEQCRKISKEKAVDIEKKGRLKMRRKYPR